MSTPRYSIFISITMTTGIVVRSMKPKIEMPKQPNERKRKKGEKYGFVWYSLAPNIVYTHSMCIFAQSLYTVCGSHLVFGICVFYSMVQRMLNAGCLFAFCPSSFLAETLTTAAPKLLPYHLPFRMRMVNGESQMRNVNFCLRKCTVYTHNMKKHTQKKTMSEEYTIEKHITFDYLIQEFTWHGLYSAKSYSLIPFFLSLLLLNSESIERFFGALPIPMHSFISRIKRTTTIIKT